MKKISLIILISAMYCQYMVAQNQLLGTPRIFDFVHSPTSARMNALSGSLITIADDDILQGFANPALLNVEQHNQVGFSHSFLFANIQHGAINYGRHLDSLNLSIHGGIQYISYGTFDQTDQFGNINGDFSASEVAFVVGASRKLNERITVGLNARFMTASFETFGASALGVDGGILYSNPDNTFAIGAVFKNFGVTLDGFTDERERPRHDVQLGLSKRLAHLPFRLNVTFHQLQQWNLDFDDPNNVATDFFGESEEQSEFARRLQNFASHILLGGEFMFGAKEQFRLRAGYNHLRNRQLSVLDFRDLTGFSLGLGFNIKRFKLDYGVAYFHVHGPTNQISIRLNPFTYNKI